MAYLLHIYIYNHLKIDITQISCEDMGHNPFIREIIKYAKKSWLFSLLGKHHDPSNQPRNLGQVYISRPAKAIRKCQQKT